MMYRFVALFLLILLEPTIADQPLYVITPQLPPTAFVGQPYACQFTVTGISAPLFTFKGLPQEIAPNSTGLIKGTPLSKGSYAITISFSSNNYKSSYQTLLRVAEPDDFPVNTNLNSSQYPAFSISANIDSYVFMAGTQVSMQFKASMGTPPYLWTYLRLPRELSGTVDGTLSGFFEIEGYFSFGVTVADRNGKSADCFITLNIQPLTFFTQWGPQASRPITDVPVRDYYTNAASQMVWKNFQNSYKQLANATLNATESKKLFVEAQKNQGRLNYALQLAKLYLKAAEQQLARATTKTTQAEQFVKKASQDLANANRDLNAKQTSYAMAQYKTAQSHKRLQNMQSICAKLAILLKKASSDLSQAQNNLTSATAAFNKAQIGFNDSQDNLNFTLSAKDIANQQYQTVTIASDRIYGAVDEAKGEVQAAKKAVVIATDAYNLNNKTAQTSMIALADANTEVSSLSKAANSAQNILRQAQMALALTLNRLYVASAAKVQADKAMAIVSAQTAPNTQNTTFLGCSQGAFPSSFGAGRVASTLSQGYLMESGQRLLFGNCTLRVSCAAGDLVSFEGYLRNENIHLLKISKIQV